MLTNRTRMIVPGLMLYLLSGTPRAIGNQNQDLGTLPTYDSVLQELPECSWLHKNLADIAPTVEPPYMVAMRNAGVKRAYLEASLLWKHGKPTQIQIYQRLFFSAFDSSGTEIINPGELKRLSLEIGPVLDSVARDRIMTAPLFGGKEGQGVRHPEGKRFSSFAEFFSTPFINEQKTLILPENRIDPFMHAAYTGDMLTLETDLSTKTQKELSQALFQAVFNPYDNTQVIQWLVKHGADPDFHGSDGITPLISSVAHPCNVKALLKAGARMNETDKWGRTALQVAVEGKQELSVRMLRSQSSPKPN